MPAGKEETAARCVVALVFYAEDTADGLLFEPLAYVTLLCSCLFGKLGGSKWSVLSKLIVESEAVADVDGVDVKQTASRTEQPIDKLTSSSLVRNLFGCCAHVVVSLGSDGDRLRLGHTYLGKRIVVLPGEIVVRRSPCAPQPIPGPHYGPINCGSAIRARLVTRCGTTLKAP